MTDPYNQAIEELLLMDNGYDLLLTAMTYSLPIGNEAERRINGKVLVWSQFPEKDSRIAAGLYDHMHTVKQTFWQKYPSEPDNDRLIRTVLRDLRRRVLALGFIAEAMRLTQWIDEYGPEPEE